MGKNYCAVKDCHNTAGMRGRFGKVVKLHHLPGNPALRSAWVRAISRKNYRASSYTQICSDHFPGGNGRTWRHNTPTLFLPQKDIVEVKQRSTQNSSQGEFSLLGHYSQMHRDQEKDSSEPDEPMEFENAIHS